ncbi:elongation factor P hydroxylase [Alteromonas ponticola]|uniref:Elongation factor P hydroxylase n=1 Tax=Alteromonas aquimaris TaxID=2998417 RepID=A0ABT3P6D2_9ALTE|nr:elongation factor P hydroxylase [Alteromonas aquimaris]MCW8108322.1 elongation factor P hydroxylase [Alteromonas aquimaris]
MALFDKTFFAGFNTRLIRGEDEPVYLPANELKPYNQVVFAHGYFSSALHEVAHWCIAGEARRKMEDYGYWYCPDGRNRQQQKEFEQVEVKPQAIERAFTLAVGRKFSVSTDNLNGAEPDRDAFTDAVLKQFCWYEQHGFPPRAQLFIDALKHTFGKGGEKIPA